MADDKYVGLIDVTKALQDVTRLMERRETLLEMMFRNDRYQDFLQKEDEQDTLPGEDDSGVSSPSGGSKVSDYFLPCFLQYRPCSTGTMMQERVPQLKK